MICGANEWTSFYMTMASVIKELNLYKVIASFHGYYEDLNDNVQQHFVYFIAAICRNALKIFEVSFYK